MTQQTAAPYTVTDLTVPYGEKIAISTNGGGIVTIWYQTGPGVSPPGFYVHDRINNEEVLLGTFAAEQVVRIDTSGSPALYDIGTSPSVGSGDADTLQGYSPDATDTVDTVALRDSNGDIQANAFESTVATGTAPFTVASTTVVPNLNASQLGGNSSAYYAADSLVVHLAGTETITGKITYDGTAPVFIDGLRIGADAAANEFTTYIKSGTWTVELYDASTGGNVSPTTVTGYYTRLGNMVFATFRALTNIDTTGMTAGNQLYITLPVSASSTAGELSCQLTLIADSLTYPANTVDLGANMQSGSDRFRLYASRESASVSNILVSAITSGTTDIIGCSFFYTV